MVRTIKQWRVTATFENFAGSGYDISFCLSDDHFTNVLRKFSEIQFDNDPIRVSITEVKHEQLGSFTDK